MSQLTETEARESGEKLGILPDEFNQIVEYLGRVPNFTELSIYSVMWSEHCSYKNSIKWLKTLPKEGPAILAEAGEENAGLVDIGDGLACAFKIESHNHPSAIEPYQGAATGVGGINRDIFTMGARPIAQLNSLRFGDPTEDRTKWLLKGVVKGIGDYGNAFGIPVLGGEVFFDPSYNQNPLVNAMSVGIVDINKTISATSYGPGNPVFIVGSSTGKDGIHGATFASGDLSEDSADDLPSVQVGDPFQEKLLLEASLEIAETDAIIGMQDMGAAGITCSSSEMSAKGGCGMDVFLDRVPTRQSNMQPFEILLSESQERMLVVVKKGREQEVMDIFDKWDLNCVEIGIVTEGTELRYFMNDELVAQAPADSLVLGGGAPVYDRPYERPEYMDRVEAFDASLVAVPGNLVEVAKKVIGHVNVGSKKWVTDQYDSMVGTINMSTNNPSDAGITNLKGTNKALAMTVDCNARYVFSDPEKGCAIAVSEAARNIVCSGGVPAAITNCLNFGNPYSPQAYWQFVGAIKGMSAACLKFKTPVTGGNVSFYNQSTIDGNTVPVLPTPTIGMIGVVEDKSFITPLGFSEEGQVIILVGEHSDDIACSQYLINYHGVEYSPAPKFDLDTESKLQDAIMGAIRLNIVSAAHDVSDGGLFTSLIEMAYVNDIGFNVEIDTDLRMDGVLFGEAQSRVILAVDRSNVSALESYLAESGQAFTQLGDTAKGNCIINNQDFGSVDELRSISESAMPAMMA
ncbi:MAG TPA: phosphoribosylformylglycinamidine synthase subunit PurL [Flavobacteriales bacterium]|nr:phosphoribosylformylglycinamidine synthase subunit PurL [Flavobacteriales bacterium]HAW19221.1 phosphoribosylformylglycinamidine synthase subunit PurL [Flavobacteriales bacterium]